MINRIKTIIALNPNIHYEMELEKLIDGIKKDSNEQVDLLVLPSMAVADYLGQKILAERLGRYSLIAKTNNLYLALHAYLKDGNKRYSRCWLIDNCGEILLIQDQTHDKNNIGISISNELKVAKTPIGSIGLLIGDDVFIPEIGRILRLQGANLFIAYSFLPKPYNPWRQWSGIWQQVQQNQVFALESGFTGSINGHATEGKSIIHGPCELTEGETGFISEEQDAAPYIAASLDYHKLAEVIKNYPIHNFYNKHLYKELFSELL